MNNIIYKKVLVLNKGFIPIATTTVKEALEDMNNIKSPKSALKIEYDQISKGKYDFSKPIEIIPLVWNYWQQLSPRDFDEDCVRTPNMIIRVPTVIVCPNYSKIPLKTFRATKKNIYKKYNGKDYWTGEDLSYNDCTLDHVKARSKGGSGDWDNIAPTSGKINRLKGNMDPKEFSEKFGYKPQYKLSEPKPVPSHLIIKESICPDWLLFLKF